MPAASAGAGRSGGFPQSDGPDPPWPPLRGTTGHCALASSAFLRSNWCSIGLHLLRAWLLPTPRVAPSSATALHFLPPLLVLAALSFVLFLHLAAKLALETVMGSFQGEYVDEKAVVEHVDNVRTVRV